MKRFKFILAAALSVLALLSCQKEKKFVEPELPVTFYNTSGAWELESWNSASMDKVLVSVTLKDKRFVLTQTVGSMYPVEYTGDYNLVEVDGKGTLIRGIYDYTYEYWSHNYYITGLTHNKMVWVSEDDPEDVYVYRRAD